MVRRLPSAETANRLNAAWMRRVFQDGAGYHEALHLAARQVHAVRTHHGVDALGHLLHDVGALRGVERRHDFLTRGMGARGAHVL